MAMPAEAQALRHRQAAALCVMRNHVPHSPQQGVVDAWDIRKRRAGWRAFGDAGGAGGVRDGGSGSWPRRLVSAGLPAAHSFHIL